MFSNFYLTIHFTSAPNVYYYCTLLIEEKVAMCYWFLCMYIFFTGWCECCSSTCECFVIRIHYENWGIVRPFIECFFVNFCFAELGGLVLNYCQKIPWFTPKKKKTVLLGPSESSIWAFKCVCSISVVAPDFPFPQ